VYRCDMEVPLNGLSFSFPTATHQIEVHCHLFIYISVFSPFGILCPTFPKPVCSPPYLPELVLYAQTHMKDTGMLYDTA